MPQDEKVTVSLPDSLQRQFIDLQNRLFSFETIYAVAAGVSSILVSFLLVIASDRIWDTPIWLRALIFGLGILGALASLGWWLRLWVFKPRDLRALAVLVQARYRRLGDRLLGIVELSDEATRPAYFSPELYHAAITQVTEEASKYSFVDAADRARSRRQVITGAVLLGLVVIPAVILPDATWSSFRRWISPLARIPRFTLVQLAGMPEEQIVAHGEKFRFSGKVNYRSFWKPARVYLELANGTKIPTRAQNGEFAVELPPQVQDTRAIVRAGDSEHAVTFLARHRPAIEEATARIDLPAYLGQGPVSESAQSGLLEVLEGSSVSLSGRLSRPLAHANLQAGDKQFPNIAVVSNTFTTPKLPVADLSELSLTWVDQLGLSNTAPWKLVVQTRRDAAPAPEIEELYRDTAILETEVLPIPLRASDDFGIKNLGLTWAFEEITGEQGATNTITRREYLHELKATDTKYLEHTFNFSPAVLGVPPESTIEIRAVAVDYLPGRERSESPIYRIHVLGNAKHAEMIRQNLESLLVQLEEVTRLEERLASETRDMKDLQKLDTPEAAKKISELEQAQQQNSAQLQELAQEGMKTLREALRNPAFNEETLMDWTRNLAQMQKLAQQQMKDAAKSLQSAAQAQGEQAREEKLAEAQEKEDEALKALQEMQEKVNQGLDELQALTLAQRLRQLGDQEKKIESTLQVNIPDTIGLTPGELGARYQRANSQLSGVQTDVQTESVKLQSEISRFFERTQKPAYGDVTREMTEAQPADQLDRVKTLIQDNVGMEAMNTLSVWADRFNGWAAKLEPKKEDSGGEGAGQGSGGEPDDAALKQLLGLLRMREKQVNIQERTRILNEHADEKVAYRDGAVLLAASQTKLNRDLSKQAGENSFAMLNEPYGETLTSMTDVENLLDRPRTDDVTRSAQDKSIAMLTDLVNLLNEQAKRSSSSSSSQGQSKGNEDMAFLMQMMQPKPTQGMQAGQTGGGNMSGGTTDRTSSEATGDSTGKAGEERSVSKSSGVPQNYPTEFREALENYYKALEQSEAK